MVLLPFLGFSQKLTVEISCADTIRVLSLYDYWGDSRMLIDTAHRNASGQYVFSFTKSLPTGLYSVSAGKQKADIIWNAHEKRMEISVCLNDPVHTMKVIRSQENAVYYDFLRVNEGLWQAIGALESAVLRYPSNEAFFDTLAQKYHQLQNDRLKLIEDVQLFYPDSYAAKLAAVHKTPFLNAYWSKMSRNKTMREDFFYGIDMADTALLRSDAYIDKAHRYMEMYMNPNASYDELQQELIIAIDKILAASSDNKQVFDFMLEYMTALMLEYNFTPVLEHLSETWMSSGCDDPSESRLQNRIKGYQKLTQGTKAPSFAVSNQEGEVIPLEKIPAEYTLVVFYTSTCSHCRQLLPKVAERKRRLPENTLEVIAISIDEDETEWERYISTNSFEWINVREAKIWDGSVASAYSIYSTPMMFLLDKNKTIVEKPNDWNELKKALDKTVGKPPRE